MFKLRNIGSLWRARGATTWLLPRTLSCSTTCADARTCNRMEERLQKVVETCSVIDGIQLLEDCKTDGVAVSGLKYSSLLHMFVQHGEHEAVDRLYSDLQANCNFLGEGTRTTMIKSYCDRQQFDKAIWLLGSITNDNIIHHTRHYNYLIKSLAKSGQTELALQLFEEKCEKQALCWASKSDKSLTADKDMLASLLTPHDNKFAVQLPGNDPLLNEDGADELRSSVISSVKLDSVKERHASGSHREEHSTTKIHDGEIYLYNRVSLAVFDYLQHAAVKLPRGLLQVIRSWFKHDPVHRWTWKTSKVNQTGTCSNCGNQLTSGVPPSNIYELETEILKLVGDVQKNIPRYHGNQLDNKMQRELEHFVKFVKEKGPFDVIIDGLNVGLHGSLTQDKVFSTERLANSAEYFFAEGKKVALIIRQGALLRNNAVDLASKLEGVSSVFVNRFKMDDLYLLYAAAFSGMQHVEIVTNDRLRDHRLLLPASMWRTFLRWTRLNCVPFETDNMGKVVFVRQKFDPVVQRAGNSWHFPATDNTWRCVTKEH